MNYKVKGIMYMIFSSFCFAVMAALIKFSGDLPTFEKVFFRNLISLFIAFFMVLYHKKRLFGKRENQKYLLIRSIFGTIGMIGYFYCIDHMLLSDSAMLNKMSPFFVIIFAVLVLKEKFNSVQIPALIIAFLGVLFIIKPSFDLKVVPALVGLVAAIFAGAAYTTVRFLGNKEEFYTIVFYFSFISSIISFPLMMTNFKPMTAKQLIILISAGCFAAVAQFSLTLSYKYAPAGEVSIYSYTNIIFSGILGLVIWNEVPSLLNMIGYIFIIGAGLIMFMYGKKVNQSEMKLSKTL